MTRNAIALRTARFGLFGPGRLGGALAQALVGAGYEVTAIAGRSARAAEALAARLRSPSTTRSVPAGSLCDHADVVFLTVPDESLAEAAAALAWRPGQVAVHCAGARGLDVLDVACARGAIAGCLHPLQSFPEGTDGATRFHGIACGIDGDGDLGPALATLASDLGATSFSLAGVDRARYHAAAVFASNYVVALHAAAERAWTLAGLPADSVRTALGPLTLGAATNLVRFPLGEALTGPIARGDAATVARHLASLAGDPALAELYRRLGAILLSCGVPHAEAEREALARVLASGAAQQPHPS